MRYLPFILILLVALGIAGGADIAAERAELERYCDMVAAGVWPDYREIYETECTQ